MKKLFSIIMCVLMVMCFMPTATFAENLVPDNSTPASTSDPLAQGDTPAAEGTPAEGQAAGGVSTGGQSTEGQQTEGTPVTGGQGTEGGQSDGTQETPPVVATVTVEGDMTGDEFLAKATDNVITLTGDVNLTSPATISSDLTINLNGHTLSTTDAVTNQMNMLNVTAGTLIINGSGTVTRADITNPSAYNNQGKTINLNGTANLTVQNDAVVKGYKGINTKYGGHAIYANTTGTVIIDHSTVQGGDCEKSGITGENYTNLHHQYQGEAGDAIEVYGSTLKLNYATVIGGKGLATNETQTTYVDGGANFAYGGAAIYMNKNWGTSKLPTAEINNSTITGGNSDLFNAEDAIQAAGTVTIVNSSIKGGSCYNVYENRGIAGSAIFQNDMNNPVSITIKDSTVAGGGDSAGSWIGCGFELNDDVKATILVEDSTISGGQATQNARGYGNAIYIPKISNYSSEEVTEHDVTLRNVTLYSHEKANGDGSVIYYYDSYGPSSVTMSGNITIDSGTLKNVNISVPKGESFTVSGTIDTTEGSVTVPEGYLMSTGRISLPVGQVGEAKYVTLEDAISEATAGQTIELLDDLTITKSITVNKSVTIDGKDHTITMAYGGTTNADAQTNAIFNDYSGNEGIVNSFTIKNLKMEMSSASNKSGYAFVAGRAAEGSKFNVKFEDCSFKNMFCGAMLNGCRGTVGPDVTITGCTFEDVSYGLSFAVKEYAGEVAFENNTMSGETAIQETFSDAAYIQKPTFTITSGTFSVKPDAYLAKDYIAGYTTDKTWTVKKLVQNADGTGVTTKTEDGNTTITETTKDKTITTETKSDGTTTETTKTNAVTDKEAGTTTTKEKVIEVKKDKDQNDVKTTTETETVEDTKSGTTTETENKVEVVKSDSGEEKKTEKTTTTITDANNNVVSETSTATVTVTKADKSSTVTETTVKPTEKANTTETTEKVTEKDAAGNIKKIEETKETVTKEANKITTEETKTVEDKTTNTVTETKTEEVKTNNVTSTEQTVTTTKANGTPVVVTTKKVEDTENDVEVKTKVENNTAKVEAKIAEKKATAETGTAAPATITVDATAAKVDAKEVKAAEVKLPATTVTALQTAAKADDASKKVEAVELKTDVATLKIDNTALKTLTGNTSGSQELVLKVEKKEVPTQQAGSTPAQPGSSSQTTEPVTSKVTATFELTAQIGGVDAFKKDNEANNGTITINISYTAPSNKAVKVYYVGDDNTRTDMNATYRNGVLTWDTNHFSTYEVEETEKTVKYGGSSSGSAKVDKPEDTKDTGDAGDTGAIDEKDSKAEAAKLVKALSLKARSSKTKKGNIKVTLTVDTDEIQAITDLGYTVKYKFYRSTKKSSAYKAKIEGKGKTYTNTSGKKGTKYYYKARIMVYDTEGTLIAKTALTQCKYASRVK